MASKSEKALFPGTFEIFHEGHIHILKKALKIFNHVIIVVSNNEDKKSSPLIDRFERVKKVVKELQINNVEVISNFGLTTDIAANLKIYYIIRGIRNGFDLRYEEQLFFSYRKLNKNIEMVLFVASPNLDISSSKIIKNRKNKNE